MYHTVFDVAHDHGPTKRTEPWSWMGLLGWIHQEFGSGSSGTQAVVGRAFKDSLHVPKVTAMAVLLVGLFLSAMTQHVSGQLAAQRIVLEQEQVALHARIAEQDALLRQVRQKTDAVLQHLTIRQAQYEQWTAGSETMQTGLQTSTPGEPAYHEEGVRHSLFSENPQTDTSDMFVKPTLSHMTLGFF